MLNNIVSMHSPTAAGLFSGFVKKEVKSVFIIQSAQGTFPAKHAASCLLKPEIDDKVLFSMIDGGTYILAVLEKVSGKSRINLKGDVSLESEGGLSITSSSRLQLTSLESVSQISPEINVLTKKYSLTTEQLSTHSQKLKINSSHAQVNIKEVYGIFERVYQRADQVIRWVETIETLNIGNWIHNIKGVLNSRAQNQIITAKSDIKVDAERIHMG